MIYDKFIEHYFSQYSLNILKIISIIHYIIEFP